MRQHAAVPTPAGIDLTYRPQSYFPPDVVEGVTHLGHVLGQARRELQRSAVAAGEDASPSALGI